MERWPPVFRLETRRILELLTGDRFYSSADAALREAVLNAVDATGRRRARDGAEPAIEVNFDSDSQSVTISDNGIGMSRTVVEELFTTIGASAAQLGDDDFQAVGEFGVGVISYFLVADPFDLQTMELGGETLGLRFPAEMLDGATPSEELTPSRTAPGTTIVLQIRDPSRFALLLERFTYWFRGVDGLTALRDGEPLAQGSTAEPAMRTELPEMPPSVETARIGPPGPFDVWSSLDGRSNIDLLYRGVFVQVLQVNGVWGVVGSINVDPKGLKPRLNRESFVSADVTQELEPFLRAAHPYVLVDALASLAATIDGGPADMWSQRRLVSLWLAIPRDSTYKAANAAWDDYFRQRPMFRVVTMGDDPLEVSIGELAAREKPIYLAPDNLANASVVVRAATRLLVARGQIVVQGFERDTGYLTFASYFANSDAALLLSRFRIELPTVTELDEATAQSLLSDAGELTSLFATTPPVYLVRLGPESAPLANIQSSLWINLDTPQGREIVAFVCDDNRGRLSLLVGCYTRASDHVAPVTATIGRVSGTDDHLGLLRREQIRGLVK